jgi:hypothetical protein
VFHSFVIASRGLAPLLMLRLFCLLAFACNVAGSSRTVRLDQDTIPSDEQDAVGLYKVSGDMHRSVGSRDMKLWGDTIATQKNALSLLAEVSNGVSTIFSKRRIGTLTSRDWINFGVNIAITITSFSHPVLGIVLGFAWGFLNGKGGKSDLTQNILKNVQGMIADSASFYEAELATTELKSHLSNIGYARLDNVDDVRNSLINLWGDRFKIFNDTCIQGHSRWRCEQGFWSHKETTFGRCLLEHLYLQNVIELEMIYENLTALSDGTAEPLIKDGELQQFTQLNWAHYVKASAVKSASPRPRFSVFGGGLSGEQKWTWIPNIPPLPECPKAGEYTEGRWFDKDKRKTAWAKWARECQIANQQYKANFHLQQFGRSIRKLKYTFDRLAR